MPGTDCTIWADAKPLCEVHLCCTVVARPFIQIILNQCNNFVLAAGCAIAFIIVSKQLISRSVFHIDYVNSLVTFAFVEDFNIATSKV
jgi:hypothetical protein